MTTITVDAAQLELLRRQALKDAATDLEHLAEQMHKLAEVAPWPAFPLNDDVHSSRSIVDESLTLLDTIGWPDRARA